MLGYILVHYNLDTKRYQGFRMGEEDTIQAPDELFVTMEEFPLWTHYQPTYVTKQDIYHRYKLYLANLTDAKSLLLEPYIGTLSRRFQEWIDDALPTSEVMLKDTCEYIKSQPNIDETLDADLDRLIASIDTVGDEI